MNSKRIKIVIFCFLLFFKCYGISVDSLYTRWLKNPTCEVSNKLIQLLDKEGYADSLYHFTPSHSPAEVSLRIKSNIAYYYYTESRFSESVALTKELIVLSKKLCDTLAWSDNLFHLGSCYQLI